MVWYGKVEETELGAVSLAVCSPGGEGFERETGGDPAGVILRSWGQREREREKEIAFVA